MRGGAFVVWSGLLRLLHLTTKAPTHMRMSVNA